MKYVVFLKGTGKSIFVGFSWESIENFIRENDQWNRMCHGWDCDLDQYEVVCIPA